MLFEAVSFPDSHTPLSSGDESLDLLILVIDLMYGQEAGDYFEVPLPEPRVEDGSSTIDRRSFLVKSNQRDI